MARIPLNNKIISSPIWKEDPIIVKLWITLLALQDCNGEVQADEDHIQSISQIPYDLFKPAFNYLLGSDIEDGNNSPKRITRIENGFKLRSGLKANNPTKINDTPLWKQNTDEGYDEYIKMVDTAFYGLMDDLQWFESMKNSFPNVLVGATLKKAYDTFWGTKSGWQNKKSKRYGSIDWKRTAVNILRYHPVYCKKGEEDHEYAYIARKKRELCSTTI